MKKKLILSFIIFGILFSSCDSKDDPTPENPSLPFEGSGDNVPANCNVEVVSVNRITADEVTEDAELGDYFFTLKSVQTTKDKISIEGRYAKSGAAAAIVTVSTTQAVGIDETIIIKISSDDINTDEDFDCMEYVVKVEIDGSFDCEYTSTDC